MDMLKKIIYILMILFLCSLNLYAGWKTPRENLEHVYILNEFRIFYTYKGKNSLPKFNRIDKNNNEIPDYIENLALRLNLSKKLYIDVLEFQDPLKSKRYQDVKYIDVHVLTSDSSSSGDGVNIFTYKYFNFRDKAIAIKLSNDLRSDTLTPSHEYFHTIQNGYSMFKNRWYTEGTSRWAEGVFREGTGQRKELPQNNLQLNQLFDKSYDAKYFWRKLAYLCDTNKGVFEKYQWMNNNIIGYPKLVKDNRVYGYTFMKRFLKNLDNEDNKVSFLRGVEEYGWDEKDQKYNVENNIHILNALMKTIKMNCKTDNEEITTFLFILDEYIKNYYAN